MTDATALATLRRLVEGGELRIGSDAALFDELKCPASPLSDMHDSVAYAMLAQRPQPILYGIDRGRVPCAASTAEGHLPNVAALPATSDV